MAHPRVDKKVFVQFLSLFFLIITRAGGIIADAAYNVPGSYGGYWNSLSYYKNSLDADWNRTQIANQRYKAAIGAFRPTSPYNFYNLNPRSWNDYSSQANNWRSYNSLESPQGTNLYNRRNGYGYYYPPQSFASPYQFPMNPYYMWNNLNRNGYPTPWDAAFRRRSSRRPDGSYWKDGLSTTTQQPATTTSRQPKRKSKLFVANVWG